jgi:hypothetical protein
VPFNLLDIGRDEQQGPLGGTALGREHSRHGAGMKRIYRQTVQRVGRQRDDTASFDDASGLDERARV